MKKMKNALVLNVNRFKEMKEVLGFINNVDIKSIKEKDVKALFDFAISRFNNGKMYSEDVRNLLAELKGEEHGEINISNVLQCIYSYERWVSGMIDWFEDFNN